MSHVAIFLFARPFPIHHLQESNMGCTATIVFVTTMAAIATVATLIAVISAISTVARLTLKATATQRQTLLEEILGKSKQSPLLHIGV